MKKQLISLLGLLLLAACGQQPQESVSSSAVRITPSLSTCNNFINNPDRLDRFFGPNCQGYITLPAVDYSQTNLAVHSDGSIAILTRPEFSTNSWRIYRYSADGRTQISATSPQSDASQNLIALQSDGSAIVVSKASSGFWTIKSFKPNGARNTFFGSLATPGSYTDTIGTDAKAIAIQPDNKILVAGSSYQGIFYVARYTANGSPDPSFGSGGFVALGFDGAQAMVLQPDGKVVLSSLVEKMLFVLRLNPDGSLDSSFGSGDGVYVDVRQIFRSVYLALQADGKILVLADFYPDPPFSRLMRLEPWGVKDPTFGEIGYGGYPPSYLFVRSDGKIAAGDGGIRMYVFDHNGTELYNQTHYGNLKAKLPDDRFLMVNYLGIYRLLP